MEDDEEDIEESEDFRKLQKVTQPTQRQIQDREDENHAVYRNWWEFVLPAEDWVNKREVARGFWQRKR